MKDHPGETVVSFRTQARIALSKGDIAGAERSFTRLLDVASTDVEALQFLSTRALDRGDCAGAVELLTSAHRHRPEDGDILHHLGAAQMLQRDFATAVVSLTKCVRYLPDLFTARLRLGIALEQTGCSHDALLAYAIAIRNAQGKGRWTTDQTTAPGLREAVLHAIRYVNAARRELFHNVLEPLRQRYGASELTRVEHSLAIYLGERSANIPDARQQPKFLYFPDIPSQPYYSRDRFPWMEQLEAGTASIRKELNDVLTDGQKLESFLKLESPQDAVSMIQTSGSTDGAWDAYFFHRHGERYDEHHARCPQTAALLDLLPLAYVREHSPETLFSVLRPGTHILPHRGVTNTRLVTHLPLIVPPDCALRVGGENHVWQEGCCVTFDDTFEHEAWNKSAETRVVLIVDSWNPDLSEAERAALSDLVGAIGDFNRSSE